MKGKYVLVIGDSIWQEKEENLNQHINGYMIWITDFVTDGGLKIKGLDFSPVKGPEGNIEYLLYAGAGNGENFDKTLISETVEKAHKELDK